MLPCRPRFAQQTVHSCKPGVRKRTVEPPGQNPRYPLIYRPYCFPLVMEKNTYRPRIFSTDQYAITLPEGHKFPVLKYGMLRHIVEKEGLFNWSNRRWPTRRRLHWRMIRFTLPDLPTAPFRRRPCDALGCLGPRFW